MSVNTSNRSILANYLLGQQSSSVQGRNYVKNSFARDGIQNVTASGTATVAQNTTTPLTAISDFLVTLPNNATDYVEWTLDTLDNSLTNQNCQLTLDYKVGSIGSVVQAQVLIGGVLSNSQTISASPTQSSFSMNVPCGTLGSATTVRIGNATGNSGTSSINVANVNYGKATNIGTVAQATIQGYLTYAGGASRQWVVAQSTYAADFGADTDFAAPAVVGDVTAPATRVPQILFNAYTGRYKISVIGGIGRSNAENLFCRIVDDLGNVFVDTMMLDSTIPANGSATLGLVGAFEYTATGARTAKLQCKTTSGGNAFTSTDVANADFKMIVEYFPSSSQQAVNANTTFDSTGMLVPMAGTSCGQGSILADGSAISRAGYAKLFSVLGTTYGTGDGSTTFNIPDSRGVFLRGAGSQTISAITYTGTQGTTQGDQFQGHYHPFGMDTGTLIQGSISGGSSGNEFAKGSGTPNGTVQGSLSKPADDGTDGTPRYGTETRPANISVKYCIVTNGVLAMPILTGSVTSNSAGAERIERFSGICSAASTIFSSMTGMSIGNRSTAKCTVTLPASTYSAAPTCIVSADGVTAGQATGVNVVNTTSLDIAGPSADWYYRLICMGPR